MNIFSQPITSRPYLELGFGLTLIKYFVEAGFLFWITGQIYTPWEFVLPFVTLKGAAFMAASPWVIGCMLAWSMPFLFVGLLLTVRRCLDANLSPWTAFWMLCPLVNIPFLIIVGLLPSKPRMLGDELDMLASPGEKKENTLEALRAVFLSLLIGSSAMIIGVYLMGSYGNALFLLTPILMTAIATHQFQSRTGSGMVMCFGLSMFCMTCALGLLLLLALEGLVCIVMAAPLIYAAGAIGTMLGFIIATAEAARRSSVVPAIVLLPMLAIFERSLITPQTIEVVSSVEIEASCEEVWPRVIEFSPITEPPTGWLAFGIAYPKRAHIDGSGVGAVRYCEFSTGDFVEPITVWDAPHRLAFNVVSQPEPMTELSPYRHLHPPHLDGYLSSKHGEFRLVPLEAGRMRLEGHTWYTIDMYPQLYWQWWSNQLIHDIHLRVLQHIKIEVEQSRIVSN